ncbi:ATP-depentend DNA [Mycena indigotica]|uniref:DNA 3'-5' helicase n=1 Tax=Mycena indigotica TaxID=2126181 RepID=A0A8H6SNQ7_9AGAR|nr:ATP-depentend DNA [Mycena indigotica]KAF7301180.1 ATP-depentend DNA [Mycena indigotica]
MLDALNPAQRAAVLHPPTTALQILAGPGSGKTKVLTSRIAHLVLTHGLVPSTICAVTFTNKAANEMRSRLSALIGKQKTSEVRMGTFHALCALFLRRFAHKVGLDVNFTICDADESKKIILHLLKPHKDVIVAKDLMLKEGTVLSHISRAKAKGLSPKEYAKQTPEQSYEAEVHKIVAAVYVEYEKLLRRNNSLDFDDLLLYGVKLFTENPTTANWCRHVLVDEFQDTNTTQYELMSVLGAAAGGCVTVVGDPDQSIYGRVCLLWRSAEVTNLSRMKNDFRGTTQILLEENYRSTASILNASLAIVSQDKSRINKRLLTTHPRGCTPVLRTLSTEHAEADFIAIEIKRLIASMGGILRYGDFAILLRYSALSRAIESALQKEAIPNVLLGGHKFFERQEIKDILSYLQLVDNPSFAPAVTRAINVPSRQIGEKSIAELASRAAKRNSSIMDTVESIHDAKCPDIKPAIKQKTASFVKTIRILRKLASEGATPSDLIRRLLDLIKYEGHLKKTQPDWESRWENVQELITFASEVQTEAEDELVDIDFDEEPQPTQTRDTPLRLFLQASMLSSEGDNQSEEDSKEKVTISTCHAAKGLEWPVVIIPAVEKGTFPFYRSEDVCEERRLLYVACTRAQSILYLTHTSKRKIGGVTKPKELSQFIASVAKTEKARLSNNDLFTNQRPSLETDASERDVISRVLGRPLAAQIEVTRRMEDFRRTTPYLEEYDALPQPQAAWHPGLVTPASVSFASPRVAFGANFSTNLATNPSIRLSEGTAILHPLLSNPAIVTVSHPSSPVNSSSGKRATVRAVQPPSSDPALAPPTSAYVSSPRIAFGPNFSMNVAIKPSIRPPILKEGIPHPPLSKSTTVSHSDSPTAPSLHASNMLAATAVIPLPLSNPVAGVKRRLGMGRGGTTGFPNKKFKVPTLMQPP